MRKILAIFLLITVTITLSGCKEMPDFMPSYWDGLTRRGVEKFVETELQEKYGEEFEVRWTGTRSGYYYSEVVGTCYPKAHPEIVFDFELNNFGERQVNDGYVQSIVREEVKNIVDSVLSEYYDTFASEVYVYDFAFIYDTGIRNAEDATIKNYSEILPEENYTKIGIALKEEEIGHQDKITEISKRIVTSFHLTNASIYFYYAPDDIIEKFAKRVKKPIGIPYRLDAFIILSGKFPYDRFHYKGSNENNKLTQTDFAKK